MRTQRYVYFPFATRKPCRHTSRTIAGQLRLTAIGIEKPQEQFSIQPTLKKLNPIGTHTCIPSAQLASQRRMTSLGQRLLNNQKIIPAGVRLHKWDHGSYSASTAQKAAKFIRIYLPTFVINISNSLVASLRS
jgi:hypothetical protein